MRVVIHRAKCVHSWRITHLQSNVIPTTFITHQACFSLSLSLSSWVQQANIPLLMECERSGSWELHFFFSDTRPLDCAAAGGLRSGLAVLEWLKSGLRKMKLVLCLDCDFSSDLKFMYWTWSSYNGLKITWFNSDFGTVHSRYKWCSFDISINIFYYLFIFIKKSTISLIHNTCP